MRCPILILLSAAFFSAIAASAHADIIAYNYDPVGGGPALATLLVEAPPASAASAWSSTTMTDIVSLTIAPEAFVTGYQPAANLTWTSTDITGYSGGTSSLLDSLTGSNLDTATFGTIFIPPIIPTTHTYISYHVDADGTGLYPTIYDPNKSLYSTNDLAGSWVQGQPEVNPVPEPCSLVLIGLSTSIMFAFHHSQKRRAR